MKKHLKKVPIVFLIGFASVLYFYPAIHFPKYFQPGLLFEEKKIPWREAELIIENSKIKTATISSGNVWFQTKWGFTYRSHAPEGVMQVQRLLLHQIHHKGKRIFLMYACIIIFYIF